MAWITPKTNWLATDGVSKDDLNRVEGNTLENHLHVLAVDRHVAICDVAKNGTVYNLMTDNLSAASYGLCLFTVYDDYVAGDTFQINETAVTTVDGNGNSLTAGIFKANETILGYFNLDAATLILISVKAKSGSGDMLKSVYDTNNDGKVDNAATLNGYGTDNGSNSVLLSGRKVSTPIGDKSTAEGDQTIASDFCSHAEGGNTMASGRFAHAEGTGAVASGYCSHASGYNTRANTDCAYAEGDSTTASGTSAHAEGKSTTASSSFSHAEGISTIANYSVAHAEGDTTKASGYASHAEGLNTEASGTGAHAEGIHTKATVIAAHVGGQYNKALNGAPSTYSATADAMVIGNGTATDTLSNAFRVTFDGNVFGLAAFNSTGADYSEFFEWLDGNPNKEDRVGQFVTLDGEKIKYANSDDYIVGIISATPAIIGDSASESWCERFVTDIFGRIQYHEVQIPEKIISITREDGTVEIIDRVEAHTELQPVTNSAYNATKEAEYLNRAHRPEWATVGIIGKLICIDDGTCTVNGYCKPNNGIATKTEVGYRVLSRLDSTHIKVLLK